MRFLPMGDRDETLAVLVSRVDDLRDDVAGLRGDLKSGYVPRGEWDVWRKNVDAERQRRHIPWTATAAFLVAAGALALDVVPKLT